MIRHCVFVHYRHKFTHAERSALYADLAALTTRLPGMRGVETGVNVSPEGLGKGFEEGMVVGFDDAAARDAYLVHPDHVAIAERLVAAAEGGLDGIMVFDFER